MHASVLLLSSVAASVLASPLAKAQTDSNAPVWTPADGTVATCDKASDKYLSLTIGPEDLESAPKHACSKMMPACAFPKDHPDLICTQPINWPFTNVTSVTMDALVESQGNKLSKWAPTFAVFPAKQPEGSAAAMWTVAECIGYFTQLLSKTEPDGCMLSGEGAGPGNLTVGGKTSLKDTVFSLVISEQESS